MNKLDKIARFNGCVALQGWRFVPVWEVARDDALSEWYWLPGGEKVHADNLWRIAQLWTDAAGGKGSGLVPSQASRAEVSV